MDAGVKDLRPVEAAVPSLVPARMVNEVLYCERLMFLEWVQGDFADNVFTVEGRLVHNRADSAGGSLPPLPGNKTQEGSRAPSARGRADDAQGEDDEPASEPRPYVARSVWLSSERLGLTARIDVVEGEAGGAVLPIEYKRGHAPDLPEGAYLPERAQLCAQVLLLREHGYHCDEAAVYFAGSRRRVAIAIDDGLVATALAAAARARELASQTAPPPPLVDDPRCNGCSLSGICLPDETLLLRRLAGQPSGESEGGGGPAGDAPSEDEPEALPDDSALAQPAAVPGEIRRLHPAHDDSLPLYVQEQGGRVGLDGDCLAVHTKTGVAHARLAQTSQVALFGSVQITTQAIRALLERGIPLSFFSRGGWYLGRATGLESKNVDLRRAQYLLAGEPTFCLRLARGFVESKVRNCRTLLRRNHSSPSAVALFELEQLGRKAQAASSLPELLGIEGTAARTYFREFSGMVKGEAARLGTFDLEGRNRRPPRDPVNALLSYAYSLLAKDFVVTLGAVGLDPLLGFYHQPRFGRPALALDLMEEFRPLVADSVVIGAINTGVIDGKDFVTAGSAVALKPAGRRNFLLAYERRMDQLVSHPVFEYRLSYRRVLEVQARLLGRVLTGELETYPSFRTR